MTPDQRINLRARVAKRHAEAYLESFRLWEEVKEHSISKADLRPYAKSLRRVHLLQKAERRLA